MVVNSGRIIFCLTTYFGGSRVLPAAYGQVAYYLQKIYVDQQVIFKRLFIYAIPFSLAAFLTQTVCFDDTTVKFEIWDTAGQENILSLTCNMKINL